MVVLWLVIAGGVVAAGAAEPVPQATASASEQAAGVVPSEPFFAFADPQINESSGLVMYRGKALTVNDSGDDAVVYVVNPVGGRTVGRMEFHSKKPVDVEALTTHVDGSVWVADIGDNRRRRSHISVWRIPEPVLSGDVVAQATKYRLRYPGEVSDAEALVVDPLTGRVVVITKSLLGGQLFVGPERLEQQGKNTLEARASMPALVTDAAFSRDGTLLFVRSYGSLYTYAWPSLTRLSKRTLPGQEQGETVAVRADGVVLVGSEGKNSTVLALAPQTPWGVLASATSVPTSPAPVSSPAVTHDSGASVVDDVAQTVGDFWSRWWWVGLLVVVGVVVVVGVAVRSALRADF